MCKCVTKLLLLPVRIRIFGPTTAKFGLKYIFLVILGQILAFLTHLVPSESSGPCPSINICLRFSFLIPKNRMKAPKCNSIDSMQLNRNAGRSFWIETPESCFVWLVKCFVTGKGRWIAILKSQLMTNEDKAANYGCLGSILGQSIIHLWMSPRHVHE